MVESIGGKVCGDALRLVVFCLLHLGFVAAAVIIYALISLKD